MRQRTLLTAFVCLILLTGAAWADEATDEHKPALGAQILYSTVPNSILNAGYQKHTNISEVGYGVWASYGFTTYDLLFQAHNWTVDFGNGAWRASGATADQTHWLHSSGLGAADAAVAILWKWRVHPAVEPYIGPNIGVAFIYGTVTEDASETNGAPKGHPEVKEIPPVAPNVGLLAGCRFYPHPNFRISVDLAVYFGLSAGLSLGYAF
jgi:hypothetical protein